jgi:hypothetical protein
MNMPAPVIVELNHGLAGYRGAGYVPFVTEFTKAVFANPHFQFNERPTGLYLGHGWDELYNSGLKGTPLSLRKELCEGETPTGHLCLSTKVRDLPLSKFLAVKEGLIRALNATGRTIVLLGEREVERNAEYVQVEHVFSIYSHVVGRFNKALDMTVPGLGLTTPTLSRFKLDCAYMGNAVATINVGVGGNVTISVSLGRTVNLMSHNPAFAQLLQQINPNGTYTEDVNVFLNGITNLI